MRLMMVRHAEPDYTIDSLTEKGWREAELLGRRLKDIDFAGIYASPLGRAQDTARPMLKEKGLDFDKDVVICDWLREFPVQIKRPDVAPENMIMWDWLPQDFVAREGLLLKDEWYKDPVMAEGHSKEMYDYVINGFDELLERHGYKRNGYLYDAVEANNDTIVLFCHFGVMSVLASHLLNVSPMITLQNTCALPSSVTIFNTEERRKGVATFRMSCFGDTSHLYAGGEPLSFMARFCECYDNTDERHD